MKSAVKYEPVEIEITPKPVRWRFVLVPPHDVLGNGDVFTLRSDFARNPIIDDFTKAGYTRTQDYNDVYQTIKQYGLSGEAPKVTVHRLAGDLHECREQILKLQDVNDVLRSKYNSCIENCKKLERKLFSAEAELYNTQVLAEKYKTENNHLQDRSFVHIQYDERKKKLDEEFRNAAKEENK